MQRRQHNSVVQSRGHICPKREQTRVRQVHYEPATPSNPSPNNTKLELNPVPISMEGEVTCKKGMPDVGELEEAHADPRTDRVADPPPKAIHDIGVDRQRAS